MDEIERQREKRKLRAQERLGTDNPRCCICPEDNPHCLERHHIAGQAYGSDTIIVCRNCHRKLTDLQNDHPKSMGASPDLVESIGRFLLGIADLFELLIKKLREFGAALIARSQKAASAT
jgi:hypothetical protein